MTKVVVFSPYYPPAFRAGGPVKSISQLVRSPTNEFETFVVTRNWDLGATHPLHALSNTWVDTDHETLWPFDPGIRRYWNAAGAVVRLHPDVVYVNSLFDPWTAAGPALVWRMLGRRRSILVVAPRGQLAPRALSQSAGRKRVLLWAWRFVTKHRNCVVHAASEAENADIRRVLGGVTSVIRPNDVGPLLPALEDPSPAVEGLRAVFLGRIVPIKGLLEMLQSLRQVGAPLFLDVYGPEEDERYLAACHSAVAALPPHVKVDFRGPVAADAVRGVLAQYDVMVNPTRGESFGQAIGESLSVGTPVALLDVTPWTDWLMDNRGGAVVENDDWSQVVELLAALSAEERRALRRGARHAYEAWWRNASGHPHIFELVVSRAG